ncbi:MAG: hypothetical protein ABW360_02060 [Phenylobacterium sp.]
MAGSSRGSWETVVDPEEKAWREAAARQRARNEAQAAEAERKHRARQIEGAAGYAGNVMEAAQVGSAVHAGISKNPKAEKFAHGMKKLGRRAGPVVSGIESTAGYFADRQQGMPADEALVRNAGRFGLGALGGGIGGIGGAALGTFVEPGGGTLIGGALGGFAGAEIGSGWSDELGDAYVRAKRATQRAAQPYTDPAYVMRALRSR